MRGTRISRAARKDFDLVVIAARYDKDGKLQLVQAYRRDGLIWRDVQLLDRETLIHSLEQGMRVAAGKPLSIEGDFEIADVITHYPKNDVLALGTEAARDELGVPQF